MSGTATMNGEGGDDMLAAEYVLHLLSADERSAAEDRLAVDGGFRALVAGWTEDMVQLTDQIAPVPPPAAVRARLAGAGASSADRRSAETARAPSGKSGLFGRWFGGTFGAVTGALAALVILAVVLPTVQPPYSGPFFGTELAADGSELLVQVRFDPRDDTLVLDRRAGGPAQGRALELWLIADGAAGPVSLGVLPDDETARITVPEPLSAAVRTGTLAISDEPPGGSPTGAPTGAVLAAGQVTEI